MWRGQGGVHRAGRAASLGLEAGPGYHSFARNVLVQVTRNRPRVSGEGAA